MLQQAAAAILFLVLSTHVAEAGLFDFFRKGSEASPPVETGQVENVPLALSQGDPEALQVTDSTSSNGYRGHDLAVQKTEAHKTEYWGLTEVSYQPPIFSPPFDEATLDRDLTEAEIDYAILAEIRQDLMVFLELKRFKKVSENEEKILEKYIFQMSERRSRLVAKLDDLKADDGKAIETIRDRRLRFWIRKALLVLSRHNNALWKLLLDSSNFFAHAKYLTDSQQRVIEAMKTLDRAMIYAQKRAARSACEAVLRPSDPK